MTKNNLLLLMIFFDALIVFGKNCSIDDCIEQIKISTESTAVKQNINKTLKNNYLL
jgi:hypothetical protein